MKGNVFDLYVYKFFCDALPDSNVVKDGTFSSYTFEGAMDGRIGGTVE